MTIIVATKPINVHDIDHIVAKKNCAVKPFSLYCPLSLLVAIILAICYN